MRIRTLIVSAMLLLSMSALAQNDTQQCDGADLTSMRKEIDALDDRLMETVIQRMKVCRQVGEYKKEHSMPALQSARFQEILDKRCAQGESEGLDGEFVKKMYELIHDESVRQQNIILGTGR